MSGGPLGFGLMGNGNGHKPIGAAPITKCEVNQAEGRIGELKHRTFIGHGSEFEANGLLHEIANTAPATGGYWKVDVLTTFMINGKPFEYKARHDVKRFDIDKTVRDHAATQILYVWEHASSSNLEKAEFAKLYRAITGNDPRAGMFPWVDELKRQQRADSGPAGLGFIPTVRAKVASPSVGGYPAQAAAAARDAMSDRDNVIRQIRGALQARSGKSWSVTGGRGTAWGWITIQSPPKRRVTQFGYMSDADRAELAGLLGLSSVHQQGVSIPSGHDHYREYVDRAMGRPPSVYGKRDWD